MGLVRPRWEARLWALLALAVLPSGARGDCGSPPRFSFAELAEQVRDSYAVGTKVKYSCRSGYVLSSGKSPLVTCLANSDWSSDPDFCEGKPCRPLEELANGRIQITDLRFGATVSFSCDDGYRMIGPASARCVISGSGVDWDKELPLCQAIPCLPPPSITHGSHNRLGEEEFAFGSAVTYSCEKGFSLIGKASIHCTTNDRVNGEWSGPAPECKVVKCDNVDVKNGRKLSGFGPYTYQNTIMFECTHGYSLVGSNVITCQANNSWSPAAPICKKGDCGSPPRFVFAELDEQARDSYAAGTKVKYSCCSGYVLSSGKSPLATCLANSNWSSDPDFCEASDSCPQLFIEHGHVTHEEKHHNAVGDVVNIECYTGYSLHGQPKIECTAEHSWQHEIPKCKLSWYIVLIICVIVIIALALAAIWIYKKFFSQKGKTVSTSPTAAYTPSKVIA